MKNMRLLHIIQILIIAKIRCGSAICSSAYGAQPCSFVPAPPGEAPLCAKPGFTYCEYPAHYPRELIHHLLEKWKYDHTTLLLDESKHELGNYFIASDDKYYYGPPANNVNPVYGVPDIPAGYPITSGPSNAYIPPRNNTFTPYYKPHANLKPFVAGYQRFVPQYYKSTAEINRQRSWSKWNNQHEKFYMRRKRSLIRWHYGTNHTESLLRDKRQTTTGQSLCQVRSQYIMPRVALNNRGDWMYVVNVPEIDGRFTQLVKSEICASQQCSGLCSIPNGYSSRCEQKYVQKRLVAVEPGGSQLYSDVFWFPSCCICTIVPN